VAADGSRAASGWAVDTWPPITYIGNLAASLASLSGSFGFYRAWDTTTAQNQQRATRKLTLPVLVIGGAEAAVPGRGTR
jgi:hypothetical protein